MEKYAELLAGLDDEVRERVLNYLKEKELQEER